MSEANDDYFAKGNDLEGLNAPNKSSIEGLQTGLKISAQKTSLKKTGRARGLFKGLNKGLGIPESLGNRSITEFLVADTLIVRSLIP